VTFLARRARRKLVIETHSAFDARAYALRVLGEVGLTFERVDDGVRADVALRWSGSDAGPRPNRHLEVRARAMGGGWSTWTKL
jgi:hypothetical protein